MPSSIHPFLETALTEFLARRVDQQMAWSPLVNRLLRAHEDGHAFIEIVDDLQDKALRSINLSPEDVSEPLVYHEQKLYFRRFFNAERGIAARLISRAEMMDRSHRHLHKTSTPPCLTRYRTSNAKPFWPA